VEIVRHRKDGTPVHAAIWAAPLFNEAGETAEVVAFVADTTREKRLAEQLQQAQKMEAVGRLAGGIAHDFNNLLTAILGYSGLMLRRMPPEDPWRRNTLEIQKAGDRAAALVRQLLAFSRKQVLVPELFDLRLLLTEALSMLRRVIGEHIELVTSFPREVWPVRADGGQIHQVILNLAVNARDAMAGGGRLILRLRNVVLDETFVRDHPGARSGPHVLLSVSDTGIGMSPETQSHLFEPFFTTKEVGKGTGLGLATVYGIVKQSGGYITVTSAPGSGSTFEIYLPQAEGAPSNTRGERLAGPAGGHETILLVEDDEPVRNLVREILESAGYRVISARSGEEALMRSRDHDGPLQLLITDVVMPGMNGPRLAREMVSARKGLRVLFTSGHPEDALPPLESLNAGQAFLHKPLAADVLTSRVREVLDGPLPEAPAEEGGR
jgi:signal transduction histidine kinase